jgi:hypothetical protein
VKIVVLFEPYILLFHLVTLLIKSVMMKSIHYIVTYMPAHITHYNLLINYVFASFVIIKHVHVRSKSFN